MLDIKQVSDKKASKPLMEKRRRARINHCLAQLKSMIIDPDTVEGTRQTKLEKADILEMTVRHLHEIKRRQKTALVLSGSHPRKKFQIGYAECAREVDTFLTGIVNSPLLSFEEGLQQRLRDHLSNRLQQYQDEKVVESESQSTCSIDSTNIKSSGENPTFQNQQQNVIEASVNKLSKYNQSRSDSEAEKDAAMYSTSVKLEIAQEPTTSENTSCNSKAMRLDFAVPKVILTDYDKALSLPCPLLELENQYSDEYYSQNKLFKTDRNFNSEDRCLSYSTDSDHAELDFPEDLTTSKQFPNSISPSTSSECEASSDSGLGMPFEMSPQRNYHEMRHSRLTSPSPLGCQKITSTRIAKSAQVLGKTAKSNPFLDGKDQGSGLVPSSEAPPSERVPIRPKRLANGDWALVVPQHLVPCESVPNPFSAFRLVWPSVSNEGQYRQQYTSSPLSSTISDMSAEECGALSPLEQPVQNQYIENDNDGPVWRPW